MTEDDPTPPQRLSSDPNHDDFHPSYARVGVTVDGQERNDIAWYDVRGYYRTIHQGKKEQALLATTIEPFWRYPETRQQRRARERWEGSR